MRVLDARGEEVGKVQFVHMGDPEAVTTEGNEDRPTDLMGRLAFVRQDCLRDTDRYASSEQVREVSGDTVRLGVAGKQLPVQE